MAPWYTMPLRIHSLVLSLKLWAGSVASNWFHLKPIEYGRKEMWLPPSHQEGQLAALWEGWPCWVHCAREKPRLVMQRCCMESEARLAPAVPTRRHSHLQVIHLSGSSNLLSYKFLYRTFQVHLFPLGFRYPGLYHSPNLPSGLSHLAPSPKVRVASSTVWWELAVCLLSLF